MAEFTVQYERKLSDANYGSEGLSLSWTWTNDDEETDPGESFEVAAVFLRKTVLTQLSKSVAERVAWAAKRELNPPKPRDDARESAEYELAAGLRDNARGDEPEDLEDLPY